MLENYRSEPEREAATEREREIEREGEREKNRRIKKIRNLSLLVFNRFIINIKLCRQFDYFLYYITFSFIGSPYDGWGDGAA